MTITYRSEKGSELTIGEGDANIRDLDEIPNGKIFPKTKTTGIKIDKDDPNFGWHDLMGHAIYDFSDPNSAQLNNYVGGIKQLHMAENKEFTIAFHVPHDYVMGSDLFIHAHWSHLSDTLTGGSCTFAFETTEAMGHDRESFPLPKTITVQQTVVNLNARQHLIAEGSLSISGGSATQLDTSHIEVDSVIFCRFYLDSNNLTDSVSVPDPYIHFVDIHYQSTGIPTKQRSPDFWT